MLLALLRLSAPGRLARPGAPAAAAVRLLAVLAAVMLLSGTDRAEADDSIPTAWQLQAGTAGLLTAPPPPEPATICIIDTGVTPTPDLTITARSSTLPGTLDDVTAKPGHPGHGTTVAHFAAAAVNGWGGSGAFPHARISSVRVFPEEGGTTWEAYAHSLNRCRKIDPKTRVTVIALGGQAITEGEAEELENRIVMMRRDAGMNVVVAAGNTGGTPDYPGRFQAAFTVAAADSGGSLCDFSARGPGVDLAAPGCGIEQTGWDGAAWALNGTSYAAPVVEGVLSAVRSHQPDMGPEDAERLLTSTARHGEVPLLNAEAALQAIGIAPQAALSTPTPHAGVGSGPEPERGGDPQGSGRPEADDARRFNNRSKRQTTRLPMPRTSLRYLAKGRLEILLLNRPRGTTVAVVAEAVRRRSRCSRIVLPRPRGRHLKVRFESALEVGPWTRVRIGRTNAQGGRLTGRAHSAWKVGAQCGGRKRSRPSLH